MEMISLTARSIIKCPICTKVQRFNRKNQSHLDVFPVNYELRSVVESIQNKIPIGICAVHDQESSLLCLDPQCNRKYFSCALCIRNLHATCRAEYIIGSRMIDQRVEFVANQYRRTPVRQMINDQMSNVFGDYLESFIQRANFLIDSLIPETQDINIGNIVQLQTYNNQLSYKLNPQTKIISIGPKDEEKRGQKIQNLKEKIDSFFNNSFSEMFDNFLNQNFDEPIQPRRSDIADSPEDQEQPEHLVQHTPSIDVTPRIVDLQLAALSENDQVSGLDIDDDILSDELNRMIRNLTDDTFVAIEFTDFEASRIDKLQSIFPNFQFVQLNKNTESDLFREYAIESTPTYIFFFKKDNEIRRVRLAHPTNSELEDLMVCVAFSNDDL